MLGWRWLDQPIRLGATIAIGTLIKIQPALLGVWAVLTGRPRAAVAALVGVVAVVVVTLPLVGLSAWSDYVTILRSVSQPITTPHNFTPGAVLYQAGVDAGTASLIQWLVVAATLVAVVVGGADAGR